MEQQSPVGWLDRGPIQTELFAVSHSLPLLKRLVCFYDLGTKFIGVLKTAHIGFTLAHLSSMLMSGRECWTSMVHHDENGGTEIVAVLWVDRRLRYFVTTASTTLPGDTIHRELMRHVVKSVTQDYYRDQYTSSRRYVLYRRCSDLPS